MPRKSSAKSSVKPASKSSVKPASKSSVKPATGAGLKTAEKTHTKTASTSVDEQVVSPPTPVVPEGESLNEKSPNELIEEQFMALTAKLVQLRSMEASLMTDLKLLHKTTLKHIKTMNKKKKRVVGEKKNRTPSGFAKPTKMSQELCKFLNEPDGTEMARTDVTKFITNYVKEHDLQNPDNRREIKCDNKLKALLNVDDTVPVTYFNLQKYMKVHFMKAESAVVV